MQSGILTLTIIQVFHALPSNKAPPLQSLRDLQSLGEKLCLNWTRIVVRFGPSIDCVVLGLVSEAIWETSGQALCEN